MAHRLLTTPFVPLWASLTWVSLHSSDCCWSYALPRNELEHWIYRQCGILFHNRLLRAVSPGWAFDSSASLAIWWQRQFWHSFVGWIASIGRHYKPLHPNLLYWTNVHNSHRRTSEPFHIRLQDGSPKDACVNFVWNVKQPIPKFPTRALV